MIADLSINRDTAPALSLPLRFIVGAVGGFVLLGVVLAFDAPALLGFYYAPHVLTLTHLFTLVFASMVALGALYQLVPVVLRVPIADERLARLGFWPYAAGALTLALGFWSYTVPALIAGGTLVLLGVGVALVVLGRTLRSVPQLNLTGRYIISALVYFGLVVALGIIFVVNKRLAFWPIALLPSIAGHALLGGVGWLTLLIVGVSYKLVPMFALTHDVDERLGRINLVLFNLAVPSLALTLLLDGPVWLRLLLALALAAACGIYIYDMRRILRRRLRRKLDITLRAFRVALGYLALSALLGTLLAAGVFDGRLPAGRGAMLYAWSGFGGWVGLTIIGMLHKIVPFLLWTHRYGARAGTERVPLVRELVDARRAEATYWLLNAGIPLVLVGMLFGLLWVTTAGTVALAAAGLVFASNMLGVLRR
jgi:cbb3-type cytochrome oxidase subunit 1